METLTNSFHDTEVRVRNAEHTLEILSAIPHTLTHAEKAHARRVRAALCGSPDCTCGVARS